MGDPGFADSEGKKSSPSSNYSSSSSHAPWYNVPKRSIVSVEHPFIIRNIEKGLKTLGNSGRLEREDSITANLYPKPGDLMARPLKSANVKTSNILLKVTVPKRTGLKRRKGSLGPYHEVLDQDDFPASERRRKAMTKEAQYFFRSLSDNDQGYEIAAVGVIGQTHRFRGMPDFVNSTANSDFMKKIKGHILPFDYEKMKGFEFDMSKGVKPNTDIIPPPSWSHFSHPFNYSYRQNPSIKQVIDHLGNVTTVNLQTSPRVVHHSVVFNITVVPAAPSPDLPAIETLEPVLQRLIAAAQTLMQERPIFTRRALVNCIPGNEWATTGANSAKLIYQYVGYMFSSGPWRDAVVRYGVDPRKDPSFRIYQTMMFMLENEPKDNRGRYSRTKPDSDRNEQVVNKESHLFDGTNVNKDGKVWQVCDITDPLMKSLLSTTNLRKECHIESDGWYHNGTWATAKIIMKAKIAAALDGIPANEASFARVIREMPNIIRRSNRATAFLAKDATPEEIRLASLIRSTAFRYRWAKDDKSGVEDGYSEEEEEEEEPVGIALPTPEHGFIDPRITEAVSEVERLDDENAEQNHTFDEMEIDGTPRLLEQSDQQVSSDE